jgi:hypothetical protein
MSTQQNAHEVEVRRIAGVLASKAFRKFASLTYNQKERLTDKCMEGARAMVAEMNSWYLQGISDVEAKSEIHLLGDSEVEELQREYGLIPSPTKDPDFYCGGNDITGNGRCTNQCGICSNIKQNGYIPEKEPNNQ